MSNAQPRLHSTVSGTRAGGWNAFGDAVAGFFASFGGKRKPDKLPRWLGGRVVIARSPTDVYAFWRRPTNLVMVFRILQTVEMYEGGKSFWTLRSQNGEAIGWECLPVLDETEKKLEWRAAADAPVYSSLSVAFSPVDAGTELIVEWTVTGRNSADPQLPAIEGFLDENAQRMLDDDLRRLKNSLEAEGARLAAEAQAEADAAETERMSREHAASEEEESHD